MSQDMIRTQRGFAFLDPKKDAVEDLLAFAHKRCQETGSDALLKRVHFLELRIDRVFGVDLLRYEPDLDLPEELQLTARLVWLEKQADMIVEICLRVLHETDEGKPRLKRILRSVIIAVGTAVDQTGHHLPLADALVLLDPSHPRHEEVYGLVCDHLPSDVRGDFELIRRLRPGERFAQTEAAINRLRTLLSGLMKAVFSQSVQTVDFAEIVAKRHILLVSLAETRYVSKAQNDALGAMVIHMLTEAVETTPRQKRVPFKIIVDECERFMNEDCERLLKMGRGWLTSLTLITQNPAKLDELGFLETVLNEPGFVACFQMKLIDDRLSKLLFYPNIDYQKHVVERDRHDGHEFVQTPTVSTSEAIAQSISQGGNTTRSNGITSQHSLALKNERSQGTTETDTASFASSQQDSEAQKFERTIGFSTAFADGSAFERSQDQSLASQRTISRGSDDATAKSQQHTHSTQKSTAATDQRMTGKTTTDQHGDGFSSANQRSKGTVCNGPNHSSNYGEQRIDTDTYSHSHAIGNMDSQTSATTKTESQSDSNTTGLTNSHTDRRGESEGDSASHSAGEAIKRSRARTDSRQGGFKEGLLTQHAETVQDGRSSSTALSDARTQGTITTASTAHQRGQADGRNWNRGQTLTHTVQNGYSLTPVAKYRTEWEEQPQLKTSVDDQFHQQNTELTTLDCRIAFVRLPGVKKTLRLQVRYVAPVYEDADEFFAAVDQIKAKLALIHSYHVTPRLSPADEKRRINAFLAAVANDATPDASPALPAAPGPTDAPFG